MWSEQEAAIFAYYMVIGEEQDEEDVQIQFEVKSDAEGGMLYDHAPQTLCDPERPSEIFAVTIHKL